MSRRVIADKVTDMMSDWARKDADAQQEAVTRLGLPPNNTASDRAKAMGFGDTQYHGTIQYFDGFDPKKTNKGIFYTSPDTELANTFATDFKPDGALPMVMPLKTRGKVFDYENPEHIDLIKNEIKPPDMLYNEGINTNPVFNEDKMLDAIQNGRWQVLERNDVQDTIKKLGFDGFNVTEGRKGWSDAKNVGLYNASDIRSPLAHFNPKYAGVGAGSVMSADLMADELDLEYKGQEPSTWDSLMNTIGGVNQEQAQAYGDTGASTMEGTADIAHMLATDPAVAGEVIGGGALSLAGATSPWIKGFGAGLLLDSGEASASPKYSDEDFIKKLEGR
jgi:hypothetical protein